jgi:transcriptional regulator with XRE-family HTH domain
VSELSEHFAATLAQQRLRADLSQEELGYLSSLHKTAIADLERGHRLPRLDTIVRLAGGLEVEPWELLEGVRYRPGRLAPGRYEITDDPSEEAQGKC